MLFKSWFKMMRIVEWTLQKLLLLASVVSLVSVADWEDALSVSIYLVCKNTYGILRHFVEKKGFAITSVYHIQLEDYVLPISFESVSIIVWLLGGGRMDRNGFISMEVNVNVWKKVREGKWFVYGLRGWQKRCLLQRSEELSVWYWLYTMYLVL